MACTSVAPLDDFALVELLESALTDTRPGEAMPTEATVWNEEPVDRAPAMHRSRRSHHRYQGQGSTVSWGHSLSQRVVFASYTSRGARTGLGRVRSPNRSVRPNGANSSNRP